MGVGVGVRRLVGGREGVCGAVAGMGGGSGDDDNFGKAEFGGCGFACRKRCGFVFDAGGVPEIGEEGLFEAWSVRDGMSKGIG